MTSTTQQASDECDASLDSENSSVISSIKKKLSDVQEFMYDEDTAKLLLQDVGKIEQTIKKLAKVCKDVELKKDSVLNQNSDLKTKTFKSPTFDDRTEEKLKNTKKPDSSLEKKKISKSDDSVRNLSIENEVNELRNQNEKLNQTKQQHDDKILELSGSIEELQEEIKKKGTEINQIQHFKEAESLNPSSIYFTSSFSSYETSSLQGQPASLPNFSSRAQSKIQHYQKENKSNEIHIEQLKQSNLLLQAGNQKLENKMLQLREQIQQMNEIIAQLNAKINPNSADAVRLNPKQQQYFDDFRRRLELQVEHFKETLVAAERLAGQNKAAAQQELAEGEKKLSELQKKVEELENIERQLAAQTEELRTALVVATRVSPQSVSARNQATIENLRTAARHLENDLRRATTEYDNAVAERLRLQEQVRQHRESPRRITQTIYNRGPGGGTTTIEQSGSNVIIHNEGVVISEEPEEHYPTESIEFD